MSEYVKYATSAGDQYLATVAEFQDSFLKSVAPFTQAATQAAAALPKMPASPIADFVPEFPTLAEITEANFAFASKLLKQQKKFAEKLFSVVSPSESS